MVAAADRRRQALSLPFAPRTPSIQYRLARKRWPGHSSDAPAQVIEIESDKQMNRTLARPLASGTMSVQHAVTFGLATGAAGLFPGCLGHVSVRLCLTAVVRRGESVCVDQPGGGQPGALRPAPSPTQHAAYQLP